MSHRYFRLRNHQRRAEDAGAAGSFDRQDVQDRLKQQDFRCHYCRTPLVLHGPGKFEVDHFLPLGKGGSNWASNIVCACPECNRRKGSRMPWEFMPQRFREGGQRDD